MKFALHLLLSSLIVVLPSSTSFLTPQRSSRWAETRTVSRRDASMWRQQPSCKSHHQLLQHQRLHLSSNNSEKEGASKNGIVFDLLGDTTRTLTFSALMVLCGALLGPFLDSYHSAFGVLQYNDPINIRLWGTQLKPALTTTWWVPELFGLAGFIIGWLYIILDYVLLDDVNGENIRKVTPPQILIGISLFTGQYWLSGVMSAMGVSRTVIFAVMSAVAGTGFVVFDASVSGFLTSLATAVGGPLIEVGLISILQEGGYHYTDRGELGFFPLWIAPVYFLGGPAVGNLARGFWKLLSSDSAIVPTEQDSTAVKQPPGCKVCNDSRCVGCPNCDAQGYYVTYGRQVKCNACRGRGLVICRSCFSHYGEDPADIESIREIMSKMPD